MFAYAINIRYKVFLDYDPAQSIRIYYGDTLKVEIAVGEFSRKSCDFFYRVSKNNDVVVALCKTGIVFFDYNQGKPVRIPSKFTEKVR